MRNDRYRVERAAAIGLFERSEIIHLAVNDEAGRPMAKTLHGVVVDDAVAWHGSPKGEKSSVAGRFGVVSCENIVATIPSHFIDPERACPATTYYESAQTSGIIEAVEDVREKAAVLVALMAKYQPEGGYRPITADDPLYRNAVKGLALWRVPLAAAVGKTKLGQNRTPEQMRTIVEGLWRRGGPRDVAAIARLLAANPETPTPAFLAAPDGVVLAPHLGVEAVDEAVELVEGAYWNEGIARARIAAAHRASVAWVGARDAAGALVATARATGDGAKNAWIYDVAVAPSWRRRGLGTVVLSLLLDHPAVRNVRRIQLGTRDMQPFYRRLGFEVFGGNGSTVMLRSEATAAGELVRR